MSSKNSSFAADLASVIEAPSSEQTRPARQATGVLAGRGNRLADLASGSLVNRVVELVDPARCRMWPGHNRDYEALSKERCHDLIESMKAQGKQEMPALVRRLTGDAKHDFEVISGARRHWSVSWLRSHNYADFRFLVEIRDLTDEEAFRLSDLENRARADISDFERARDYLQALGKFYGGKQGAMAERLRVSDSWMSRYLDLARLPPKILSAFASPHDLGIKHVTMLKPLLKPADRRAKVEEAASELAARDGAGEGGPRSALEVIRYLIAAADAPKRSGAPKKSGSTITVANGAGTPVLRIDRQSRKAITVTLLPRDGATRGDARAAINDLLDRCWSAE